MKQGKRNRTLAEALFAGRIFFEWQFVSAETIRISFEAKGNHGKHDDDAVDTGR